MRHNTDIITHFIRTTIHPEYIIKDQPDKCVLIWSRHVYIYTKRSRPFLDGIFSHNVVVYASKYTDKTKRRNKEKEGLTVTTLVFILLVHQIRCSRADNWFRHTFNSNDKPDINLYALRRNCKGCSWHSVLLNWFRLCKKLLYSFRH